MTAAVLAALAPIALLIALGYGLNRSGFLDGSFWSQAERACYYILLPALFVHGLGTAALGSLPVWNLAAVLIGATVAGAALALAIRPWLKVDGAAFTSIFQGSIRFNNYVGIALAAGVFGGQGVALAAICNAAIVPTVNLLCVLVFARYGARRLSARAVLRQIATNPLILASIGGIALQALGTGLPPGIEPALRALGSASMPLGLLCVGAALRFGTIRSWMTPVLASSAVKFVAIPAVTLLIVQASGLTGPSAVVALLFQALPTASSSYILARQLGGDAPLMAGITATQTVLAALTIPAVMAIVGATLGFGL